MADLGSKVVVLEADEPRTPSEEEVKEYAAFLGIDVDNEPHLMWIAWEGVAAPVPPPWKACHNLDAENEDEIFYFNFETAESVWDHPCDEKYRQMVEQARADRGEEERRVAQQGAAAAAPEGAPSGMGTGPLGLGGPEVILGDIEEADEETGSSSDSSAAKKPGKKQPAAAQPKKDPIAKGKAGDDSDDSGGRPETTQKSGGLTKQTGRGLSLPEKEPADDSGSEEGGSPGPGASDSAAAEAQRKRLQPITDEISGEESVEEDVAQNSSMSGSLGAKPKSLPPLKGVGALPGVARGGGDAAAGESTAREHGLAGVGLAPAKSSEEVLGDTADGGASPGRGANASKSSESAKGRKLGDQQRLDRSGQSGRSGPNDSLASEISEDFASEYEASSMGGSRTGGGGTASKLGDTLELSASCAAEASGGAETLEAQIDSLARSLNMLRDIRMKQKEYLKLLQAVA